MQEVAASSRQAHSASAAQLKTDRDILKYILLSLVTFGIFIIVGPFAYFNKLFTAMNLLSEDYNRMGC